MSRTNWRDTISQLDTRRGTLRVWVQTNSGAELLAADDDARDLLDALAAVDLWGVPGPPGEDDEVAGGVSAAGGAQYLAERARYLAEFASRHLAD